MQAVLTTLGGEQDGDNAATRRAVAHGELLKRGLMYERVPTMQPNTLTSHNIAIVADCSATPSTTSRRERGVLHTLACSTDRNTCG